MKDEKGLGIIGIIITIITIIVIIVCGINFLNNDIKLKKDEEIRTNMLSIQGACRVLKNNSIAQKNTDMFVGTKISDMTEDSIINEFKSRNIIEESLYEKYYCLNNDNLKQLNILIPSFFMVSS